MIGRVFESKPIDGNSCVSVSSPPTILPEVSLSPVLSEDDEEDPEDEDEDEESSSHPSLIFKSKIC